MQTNSFKLSLDQAIKMLRNMDHWLEKSIRHADMKKFDPDLLLQCRLVPDQFPLVRQIQIACDTVKLGMCRVVVKDAPVHVDSERTMGEIRARIADVLHFLGKFTAQDFAQSAEAKVTTPRWDGKWMTGEEFLNQHMLPNFYFHAMTAYSILRHNGVDLGKGDFLGQMPFKK